MNKWSNDADSSRENRPADAGRTAARPGWGMPPTGSAAPGSSGHRGSHTRTAAERKTAPAGAAEPVRRPQAAQAAATAGAAPAGTAGAGAAPGTTAKQPATRKRSWKPLGWTAAAVLLLLVVGFVTALSFALAYVRGLDISKLATPLPAPSYVLDAGGQPIAQLQASKQEPVKLAQIPQTMRNAVIAVEDRRFYEHAGFDPYSIGRAVLRDVKAGSLEEGGSTITQQLAKNMFLDSSKVWSRKLKELGYAVKINTTYSKDEILELYLNSIYFGEGSWGIQSASKQYFGKPVEQLTLAESALLAGLPKAPSAYSPLKHPEKALERRNLVLSLMKDQELITPKSYDEAVAAPIGLRSNPDAELLSNKYPSFIDYVLDEAEQRYGYTEKQVLTMGLQIHTSLNTQIQQAAQDVYAGNAIFPASPEDQQIQSGMVIIDQHTGQIRAIVGGRGKQVYRGFNRATELKRQPGSSFKPLAVYGPALERGYSPDSMLFDGDLNIAGYQPKDWDSQTRGQVSMRQAILSSWNIPAVWLLNEIGLDASLDYLKRSGITLPAADRTLSIALGGLSEGVSPLQMAQAYSAFANQGVLNEAHAITQITTKDGQVLAEPKQQPTQLISPLSAYYLTSMLQEAATSGTGRLAALDGRPTAGKTGTTQLPPTAEFSSVGGNSAKDSWFVGYTPELTAAIWLGYDRTDAKHYVDTSVGSVPALLFKEIMTRSLAQTPVTDFTVPEAVQKQLEEQRRQAELLRQQQQADQERRAADSKKAEKEREKQEKQAEQDRKRQELIDRIKHSLDPRGGPQEPPGKKEPKGKDKKD